MINFTTSRLDLHKAFNEEPAPLDFIWPGFLAGTVGALFAPGATSKSFLAIQAGVAISSGKDMLGLGIERAGRVVYIGLEDRDDVLKHRAYAIGKRLSPEAREASAERFDVLFLYGDGLDIMAAEDSKAIVAYCSGARLIIVDTFSRAHRLDENSNSDMSRALSRLEWITRETGASLLFLHHISKGASRNGEGGDQHAARGASALTDNARYAAALARMSPGLAEQLVDREIAIAAIGEAGRGRYVQLTIPKNNYSAPIPDRWYRRGEGGVLEPTDLLDEDGLKAAVQKYEKAAAPHSPKRGLANIVGDGADEFDKQGKDIGVVNYEDLPF